MAKRAVWIALHGIFFERNESHRPFPSRNMLNSNLYISILHSSHVWNSQICYPNTFLLPTQFENMKPSPCHSQELKELNQWPLFLVTFRLDYASFLTEMEVDVKLFTTSGKRMPVNQAECQRALPGIN